MRFEIDEKTIGTAVDQLQHHLDDRDLVETSQAINWLLDMFNVSDHTVVQATIGGVIGSLSGRNLVCAEELAGRLRLVKASAFVESAFDRFELTELV